MLDVKLDNVLVNYSSRDKDNVGNRFTDVELAECGATYNVDHEFAKEGVPIGAPVWRSPEVIVQLPEGWNTATNIWSFGLCVRLSSQLSRSL